MYHQRLSAFVCRIDGVSAAGSGRDLNQIFTSPMARLFVLMVTQPSNTGLLVVKYLWLSVDYLMNRHYTVWLTYLLRSNQLANAEPVF